MSAHTPGPWIWGPNARLHADTSLPECLRVLNVGVGKTTALCWDEHDARLIAAAPALLAALQNCANVLALALPSFDDESTDGKDSRDEVESVLDAARDAIERATGGAP